jgi:predicted membrane chloride channel (bestrophin family)
VLDKISEECENRYGTTYNDLDGDALIDTIENGEGDVIGYREFNKLMKYYLNGTSHE